jgi:O-antigen/teichoic acid export membrane protein
MTLSEMNNTLMRKLTGIAFLLSTLAIISAGCAPVQAADVTPLNVFYAGAPDSVKSALDLAVESGTVTLVSDMSKADALVLNGLIPEGAAERAADGIGYVLILGDDVTEAQASELLGTPVTLHKEEEAVSLTDAKSVSDPLLTEIIWNGAPQVRERWVVEDLDSAARKLVVAYEDGEGILQEIPGRGYLLSAVISDAVNPQIQEWGYFNYLVYHLAARAGGITPLAFADYPASPIPHADDRNLLFIFLGAELIFFFVLFVVVRRYSLAHPEALDSLVADKARFLVKEAQTDWERVGFHRPLSGLLVGMGLGILLFIPLIIYQNLILPQFILPSAQALGMWGRVTQFFGLTWVVFDMGTSMAAMKFLSQYRVSDPARGFKYVQVYVWWQALSGAIQVALVVTLTSLGIVRTPYALFAWSIIVHSLIQIPGFYGVMRTTLNGLQRYDYARYIDTIGVIIMPMVMQLAIVPVFYAWGRTHPAVGSSLSGVIGLGAAAYMVEFGLFLLGLWLYKRLGYKASVLFMAHFDWSVIKDSFRFGFFDMMAGILVAAGAALEIWITQQGLVNYSETWGNWLLAGNFLVAFTVSTNLFDGVMPAISEALSNGRKLLSQYYSVQSYKWGAIASAVLAAILLVVAPKFIIGSSGEEFQRAAVYAIPLTIFGSIQFLGWLGDAIFLGANKPSLRFFLVLGEQLIRISLMVILLERFQIFALLIAYFVAILARGIIAYFVADRYCFPQRFYFWQSVASPVVAAMAYYLFLNLLAKFVWQGDEISSIILFFLALVPFMPVFFFFYALAGGWDVAGLIEVDEASHMTGFLRPVVNVIFIIPSKWGARISPLHNRFPITMRELAQAEARSLTEEKVKLVTE